MKLGTFAVKTSVGEFRRIGVATAAGVVDATAARVALLEKSMPASTAHRVGAAQVPPDMIGLLGAGRIAVEWIAEAVDAVVASGESATSNGQTIVYREAEIKLLAPVPRPPGIANFSVWPTHTTSAAEKGFDLKPAEEASGVKPYWKGNPDTFVGPGAVLEFPPYADELDVECELVCIVGTGGRNLDCAAAEQAIAGYTIVNDVSARDIQRIEMKTGRGPAKGKDFDTGNVMGPWLVTPDEVGDVRTVRLSLHVNGKELSSSDASGILWDFPEMLSYLSLGQTIHPGHVISAGCYAGGSGLDLNYKFQAGDLVELRISRIGSLVNRIGVPARAQRVTVAKS
ncbi:MAG: fumarylacetoacetate hydrolase family protein [Betaproteobacteria bacterium]|nr:fumarylacetoacetate hydrolase family protein [Betaproteobacteria bacterium]